jgi:hypothetical protein
MAEWVQRKDKDGNETGAWLALPDIQDARLAFDILKTDLVFSEETRKMAERVIEVWGMPIGGAEIEPDED